MQGQSNSTQSMPDHPLQFDCESNPNNFDMDQPIYSLLSSNDTNMDCAHRTPQATQSSQETGNETKVPHESVRPLETIDLNLNSTPVDDGHALPQSLVPSFANQTPYRGNELSTRSFMQEFNEPEHVYCSNPAGSLPIGAVQSSKHTVGTRNSAGIRLLGSKRKNMEEVTGQSSTINTPSSSEYLLAGSSSGRNPRPGFSSMDRGASSERRLSLNFTENSQMNSNVPSSFPSASQLRARLTVSCEESNIISSRNSAFRAATSAHLAQVWPNWNSSNFSSSLLGNGVSTSSGIIPLTGPISEPRVMVPVHIAGSLTDALFRPLVLPGRTELGNSSTPSPSRLSGAVPHGHSLLHSRAATRQPGLSPSPLLAWRHDGRNRMISEIHSALDFVNMGVNSRFEDFFIFDQSRLYGHPYSYDRHRDMRLDVDNLSYEDLLVLEEMIGHVCTGLCEQTALQCLKQRNYGPHSLEGASKGKEPCCICREVYYEGDAIGTLICMHEFHTACIKKWLMIKNLCPICKAAAFVEGQKSSGSE